MEALSFGSLQAWQLFLVLPDPSPPREASADIAARRGTYRRVTVTIVPDVLLAQPGG